MHSVIHKSEYQVKSYIASSQRRITLIKLGTTQTSQLAAQSFESRLRYYYHIAFCSLPSSRVDKFAIAMSREESAFTLGR